MEQAICDTSYNPTMVQFALSVLHHNSSWTAVAGSALVLCHVLLMYDQILAAGCLVWYASVIAVTTTGTIQIFRHFAQPPPQSTSSRLQHDDVPHVTIIRPCKGLEPFLYECLASTFHQDYPAVRLTVHFCVSTKSDPAYAVLQQLVKDYPNIDARIFIEDEDPFAQGQDGGRLGPNPKIRNMSRAYREARGGIIWIFDCNMWVGHGVLGRMVDKLCGFSAVSKAGPKSQTKDPYKLVAHVPISVDVDNVLEQGVRPRATSAADNASPMPFLNDSDVSKPTDKSTMLTGSALDAMFLATMHGKFFVGINTVHIAPCCNGKSAMFRKSHLDYATKSQGLDYFSHNICEDHLIADLLWRTQMPATPISAEELHVSELTKSNPNNRPYRNPDLVLGDVAIQPVAGMTIQAYIARRVRWIRVRKYTVLAASIVEGATESLVCSAMGAYGLTTLTPLQHWFGCSWSATSACFMALILCWTTIDWYVSGVIQGLKCVENQDVRNEIDGQDRHNSVALPAFVKPPRRHFATWLPIWLTREFLAGPIWFVAVCGGGTITWRDKQFWVGMDMKVHEFGDSQNNRNQRSTKSENDAYESKVAKSE